MRIKIGLLIGLFWCFQVFPQTKKENSNPIFPLQTQDSLQQKEWVDHLYDQMSLEEKVGQLFMIDLFPEESQKNISHVENLIKNYHVGGVIFFKGTPVQQAGLTNRFQKLSKVPLLMGQDAEWGLAMRLDSTYAFPWNMTLGAIQDNELIKKTGAQIAKHAKRIGLQFDFAPSVDVNINPNNPIIGNRSFGENPKRVTEKGIAFVEGMQSEGILTTAKHFPGHGDTEVDSHNALPLIDFPKQRLDSVELYPYAKMIPKGLTGVMVSHLNVPALDSRRNHPATVSHPIITGVLKRKLNFNGLIVTDALNMKGIADYNNPGQISLEAFLAGNDILLYPVDVPNGIKKIINAYKEGIISEERLAHSVKKILMAKYKTGLHEFKPVNLQFLTQDLNEIENDVLYEELMEHAITLIKNNKAILPVKDLDKKKIAYVPMGDADGNYFFNTLNKYTQVDEIKANRLNELLEKLKTYDEVIVGFHKADNPWASYKFNEQELVWLHEISIQHPVILSVFTRPYSLLDLRSTSNLDGILMVYQNSKIAQEKAAQVIFGAIGAKGKLPVSAGRDFPEGTGFYTSPISRLSYGTPESVGMSSFRLKAIDSIAKIAIDKKMTPGMQVLVARKGKVIFQKNYGFQTYENKIPITDESIYDLASLTKILAALPLLMELEEKEEISFQTPLKELLPFLKNTNKADITVLEALSHYGKFKSWIPFYRKTLNEDKKPSEKYYASKKEGKFNVQVAENMFMRSDYRDSVLVEIAESDLRKKEEYKYSDLPFYLFNKFLEDYYHSDINILTKTHFYASLGAGNLSFLPKKYFLPSRIVPSEVDKYWRNQKVHAYVNDQGAAMFGGLAGHAGLFGNANDVAKMMQMYLNGGYYGGKKYFEKETLKKFNTCYFCRKDVRRGVGFDKPQLKGPGPGIKQNSKSSFGHTGFTGTIAWADPEEDLLYICLTNRTYPDPGNDKLIKENIRSKIAEIIYQSIIVSKREEQEKLQ